MSWRHASSPCLQVRESAWTIRKRAAHQLRCDCRRCSGSPQRRASGVVRCRSRSSCSHRRAGRCKSRETWPDSGSPAMWRYERKCGADIRGTTGRKTPCRRHPRGVCVAADGHRRTAVPAPHDHMRLRSLAAAGSEAIFADHEHSTKAGRRADGRCRHFAVVVLCKVSGSSISRRRSDPTSRSRGN